MGNTTTFFRSTGCCPTKKREKSKVRCRRADRAIQIHSSESCDLIRPRFEGDNPWMASGRFNGKDLDQRASSADSIACRACSGLQAALDLGVRGATEIQIGREEDSIESSKVIWPMAVEQIWRSPRESRFKASLRRFLSGLSEYHLKRVEYGSRSQKRAL